MVDRWSNPQKYGVTNVQIEAEGEMKEKGGGRSQAEEMKGRRQLGYSFFFLNYSAQKYHKCPFWRLA